MSMDSLHTFKCDNCETREESKHDVMPRAWVIVKMETTNGAYIHHDIHLCNDCAFPSEREKRSSVVYNLFKKFVGKK